jgi:exodeoxyribonuclease V beta subunit
MSAEAISHFDVCGELPTGVTLLEASAGTGKTFAIAAIATRLVADGVDVGELLLVTFTRMATGELRERVRDRMVSAERGLATALAGGPLPGGDDVLALLARGTRDEVELRRRRLREALATFDEATIATTHGFCQHVLAGLGVRGDLERDVTFVEDLSDLTDEVVDDLYVRKFARDDQALQLSHRDARRVGRAAIDNAFAILVPEPGPEDDRADWAVRVSLAKAVRKEVELRKRRLSVMTYDDQLGRLRDTLVGAETGPAACAELGRRFRHVLVDEFQDTDPAQWDILRSAFGRDGGTLILIGDPKQAIYSFRGADVFAYLDAAASAETTATLGVNWRSDQGLIDGLDALFGGAQLGHPGIVYRKVEAAAKNREPRLAGAPAATPLRVRVLRTDDALVAVTRSGYPSTPGARELFADDLAQDVVQLLSSSATVKGTPVRPRHLAVLVRTNRQAALVQAALERAGVPAVINGAGSVFATVAASDWLRLLQALERPESDTRARAFALTDLLGWTADRVAEADERDWEAVHARLHRWAGVLRQRGAAALFDAVSASEGLARRVLAFEDGERQLTDLRHVAQLLHAAASQQELGVASLTAWLRQRMDDTERDAGHEERALRLDSDAEAVQVLTIHRSKGLEFPIVYVPFAWDPGWSDDTAPPVFHDPAHDNERAVDVGFDGPGIGQHRMLMRDEARGEDLRLLYVALTRARHQVLLWWAGASNCGNSPLGRLLFARRDDGSVPPTSRRSPDDDTVIARLTALANDTPGRIAVEIVEEPGSLRWQGEAAAPVALEARRFTRAIDLRWGRTSYSGIVAGQYEAWVGSEPEQEVLDDEAPGEVVPTEDGAEAGETALRHVALPLAVMPGGVDVGDLVHRVLKASDFAAPDLAAELAGRLREQRARRDTELGDSAQVLAGLQAALETPLGPVAGGLRLCDIARADRLDELAFELPLAGGDEPAGVVGPADIAALLEAHVAPDDPVAGYAERLRDPALRRELRGYLNGLLDLVARVPGADGSTRFVLVDYKTNWLGSGDEELSAWHYRPQVLAAAMQHAHYPLQALLYLVALHRYLRWRLPGYAAERDLGGVLYLFLRGMIGEQTPVVDGERCGVFAWRPPAALVIELSDLLDRGRGA